jgi:hypothetical protein
MNFLAHNLSPGDFYLKFEIGNLRSTTPDLKFKIYSSDFVLFFLAAFLVAGFSDVSELALTSDFEAVLFALGAAAAPPRLRPLLSASFAGLAVLVTALVLLPFGSGFSSLLSKIVT